MNNDEKLIAEARDAMITHYISSPGREWNWHEMATIALSVFEKAHTLVADEMAVPGFAEREKRAAWAWEFFTRTDHEMTHDFRGGYHQGVIDEAGRRSGGVR